MASPPRTCQAAISLESISHNARILSRNKSRLTFVADVSSDGYGHGIVPSARAAIAGGARAISVSSIGDARVLREAGVSLPIVSSRSPSINQLREAHDVRLLSFAEANLPEGSAESRAHLYGLGRGAEDLGFSPAMRVTSVVIGMKTIDPGEGVSYGYTYRVRNRTNIAMIAMGYADGLDRCAGNSASVLLGGAARRIIGRVAMNAAMVELGNDSVDLGDEVVIFGTGTEPRAFAWASELGISDVEVATVFGRHIDRTYL